ncbi:MAG: response regulator [Bdellovibrionales bacterium]
MQCILVVEDNDDLRQLYRQALHMEGYSAVMTTNGREALDLLHTHQPKPRLIILDLMMPVMDGWEFLREQSKDENLRDIPVVVCSAAKDQVPSNVRFIRKPVDLNALLTVVEEHCK